MAPTQTCNNLSELFLCIFCLLHTLTATADSYWHKKRHPGGSGEWLNHGGDINAHGETSKISPSTVSKLGLEWESKAGRDIISATPAIFNGTLYYPRWNGYLYAVKVADGSVVWKKDLQKLTGLDSTVNPAGNVVLTTVSISTPTVACDLLIIGIYGPAFVVAVERATGKLVWSTQLDTHPSGVVTMSGTFHNGGFYVGTSSLEELLSIQSCCTFRGSFAKLDFRIGAVLWQTFMLPDNHGNTGEYAGAAVWGSRSPPIDACRSLIYIATGNLYSAPLRIRQCQQNQNNQTVPTHPDRCVEPDNHSNSMMALDLNSGEIKWYRRLGGYDVWFIACFFGSNRNCPPGPSVDADFGEVPMILSATHVNGTEHLVVVAVQKSGFAWALDRDNGNIVWSTVSNSVH